MGDGAVARFERAIAPYAHRFAEAPAVLALRESLPLALAAVVIALVALILAHPFRGWPELGTRVRDDVPSAFSIASIVMVVALSLRLAARLRISAAATAGFGLLTFALAMPRGALRALAAFAGSGGTVGLGAYAVTFGASGLFTAILVCLAVAGAVVLGRRQFGSIAGQLVGGAVPTVVAGVLFALQLSPAAGLAAAVAPLATLGDSWFALIAITAIESALWLVGIHGPALFSAIVLPVYLALQAANTAAAGRHEPIPHIVVVSTFLFVFPGGAGATLPLVLLLLRSRVRRLRRFAAATLFPSLLNVNEPVMFGLPVAYNPVFAAPFVLCPVVLSALTYAALALNWVGRPIFYVPSAVPTPIAVFLATLDWRACVLALVNVVVAGAIWLPFVRVYERIEAARA
ncbi:MAG TPA: PTS transporter subunit EIIC [Candidatus Elarobacter sp.]|nr:PTS transporter subunit EIIC [Candidatus Elarobacter sp.]